MADNLARQVLLRDDVVFLNHGSFGWQQRSIARVSVQGYNSKPQMDLLVGALAEILAL